MCHKCSMACSSHSALVKWCRNISDIIYRLVHIIASKQADLKSIYIFDESLIVTVKQYYTSTVMHYKTLLRNTSFPDHVVPQHTVMHIIQEMKVILSRCIYGLMEQSRQLKDPSRVPSHGIPRPAKLIQSCKCLRCMFLLNFKSLNWIEIIFLLQS